MPTTHKLWKKKLRIYIKKGKGIAWRNTDAHLQDLVQMAEEEYFERLL